MKEIWILVTIGMGLWTIYWLFVRPIVLLATRMELFKIRHALRTLSDTECPPPIRKKLEYFCNQSLRIISDIDISDLIMPKRKGDEVEASRDIEDILNSTEQSKAVFDRMVKTVMASIVANSALLLIPALLIIALAVWFSCSRSLIAFAERRTWFLSVYGTNASGLGIKMACP